MYKKGLKLLHIKSYFLFHLFMSMMSKQVLNLQDNCDTGSYST